MTRGWQCQAPEHDADHGEAEEGDDGSGIALEVADKPAVAADPGEEVFDDPAARADGETDLIGVLRTISTAITVAMATFSPA